MSTGLNSAFRRIVLLTLLSAVGGAAFKWIRDQRGVAPRAPAWPPFEPTIVAPTEGATTSAEVTADAQPSWMGPTEDGVAPVGFSVKVKTSSGIYHVPGGRFHERTVADRYYASEAEAEADGYRPSKS